MQSSKPLSKLSRFEPGKFQAICTFSKSSCNHIHFLREEEQFLVKVQNAAATASAVIYEADYII